MNQPSLLEPLISILQQVLSQSGSRTARTDLAPTADFAALAINSVDLMEFILRVEREFDVDLLGSLNPDDAPHTLDGWAALVQRRLDRSSSAT
jgi:acyl carrier protein